MSDAKQTRRRGRPRKAEEAPVPEMSEGQADSEAGIPDGATEITWERPTGFTLTTNASQNTIDYARANGWKVIEAK